MLKVKSIAVEGTTLYTARDLDVVITDISPGIMSYSTKGTFEGRAPLLLIGASEDEKHKKFIACITRDGKGITLVNNQTPFKQLWTKEVSKLVYFNLFILEMQKTLFIFH